MSQAQSPASIELRVQRAPLRKKEERLLAIMHPTDKKRLQLKGGEFVLLTGTYRTTVQLTEADAEAAEGVVLLADQHRANTGVEPGDSIDVAAIPITAATSVTLAPISNFIDNSSHQQGWLARFFHRAESASAPIARESLSGIPVMQGDEIKTGEADSSIRYRVVQTIPEGPVLIDSATQIHLAAFRESAGASVSYDEVGGLRKEVARVREMVELPMRHPEIFQHLGIAPPRGLLLYGPPGCGKTLIARAVARDSGAHFIHVNGPEIIQKHYGESEELLRNLFAEAQRYESSILFFDEIDAIAPNRETVLGDVEKRVVAQLLALMDGIESRGQIIVLAATNLPNNVDPA